jgi:trans-2-enoyl-CoA reductase
MAAIRKLSMRTVRQMSTAAKAVKFNQFGAPQSVLSVESDAIASSLGPKEVLVKMMMFPITPGDFRQIEGYSGACPGVAGTEGVGTVVKVGSGVTSVSVDDRVIPSRSSFGTWREMAVVDAESVQSIPASLTLNQAAMLGPSSCTALRLLNDFASLKEGDWIIQNGANGTVGQAVIQLAKAKGVKTINVVRGIISDDDTVGLLQGIGGDFVVPESYIMSPEYKRLVADLPKPKLALNCVGGDSATNLARALGDDAHMVTYGGVSRNGVTVPTSALVSKNLTLAGFSYKKWAQSRSASELQAMTSELAALAEAEKLTAAGNVSEYAFTDFNKGLASALSGYYVGSFKEYFGEKVLITFPGSEGASKPVPAHIDLEPAAVVGARALA